MWIHPQWLAIQFDQEWNHIAKWTDSNRFEIDSIGTGLSVEGMNPVQSGLNPDRNWITLPVYKGLLFSPSTLDYLKDCLCTSAWFCDLDNKLHKRLDHFSHRGVSIVGYMQITFLLLLVQYTHVKTTILHNVSTYRSSSSVYNYCMIQSFYQF